MLNSLQKLTREIWRALPRSVRVLGVRATQTTFTVSATAIIFDDKGQVLLLDHVLRPNSGWALPGGFLQQDELAHEGLRREIREEIGLTATRLDVYFANTFRRHIEIFFLVEAEGEPRVGSSEIIGYRWFRTDELPPNMSHIQRQLIQSASRERV